MTVKDGMIVWKYADEGDTSWRVLISLSELAGVDGKDGTDGEDGIDGEDGLTPYIGDNGNWYIGNEDTGVASVIITY